MIRVDDERAIEKMSGWYVNKEREVVRCHVELFHYEVSSGGYYDPPEPCEEVVAEITVHGKMICWGKGLK